MRPILLDVVMTVSGSKWGIAGRVEKGVPERESDTELNCEPPIDVDNDRECPRYCVMYDMKGFNFTHDSAWSRAKNGYKAKSAGNIFVKMHN